MLWKQFQVLWEHTDPCPILGLQGLLGGVSIQAEAEKDSNEAWLERNLRKKALQVEKGVSIQSSRQNGSACARRRGKVRSSMPRVSDGISCGEAWK